MARTAKKIARRSAGASSVSAGTGTVTKTTARTAGRKLVVVESPAKARTINRYLGREYLVKASMGHVRDLPPKAMGVDVRHGFAPTYEPLAGRRRVLTELKKYARAATEVFLATDLDREGEAIAWHLAESLGVRPDRVRRVIFNEITPAAIRQAFAHPRTIDMNKVNAQQARRILDRIVGYEVSPLLWRKVAPGLSAGRVQSVAVRLIVEREQEIDDFSPEEYWRLSAVFTTEGGAAAELAGQWSALLADAQQTHSPARDAQQRFLTEHQAFRAELAQWCGQRFKTASSETALEIAKALGLTVDQVQRREEPSAKGPAGHVLTVVGHLADGGPAFVVRNLQQRDSRSRPQAPLTTASMQQAAAVQLRFSAARTMRIAQQLYEGVEIPQEGSVGLITYMRTDSTHLSAEAVAAARQLITQQFGPDYLPDHPNVYNSGQQRRRRMRPSVPPSPTAGLRT